MLNRRKQQQDFNRQAGDEHAALLGPTTFHDDESNDQQILNINSPPNQIVPNLLDERRSPDHQQWSPGPQSQVVLAPIHRRVVNRSTTTSQIETQSHIRPLSNQHYVGSKTTFSSSISSSSSGVPFQEELYELGVAGNTSHSRAIDINSSVLEAHRNSTVTDFIYYTVQPGDTLQNISVKYSCPVSAIKRLNNLWSDQEFFALSRLKLPVGKLGLLADALSADNSQQTNNNIILPSQQQHASRLSRDFSSENEELNLSSTDGNSIFKDLDLNIEKARTAARSYGDNASAIMQTLAQNGNIVDDDGDLNDPNRIARREAETLLNDMSDYGLTYSGLILFIFIVCLICPLAYVIYLEETSHHHDSSKAS